VRIWSLPKALMLATRMMMSNAISSTVSAVMSRESKNIDADAWPSTAANNGTNRSALIC